MDSYFGCQNVQTETFFNPETLNAIKITFPKKSIRPNNCVTFKHAKKTAQAAK